MLIILQYLRKRKEKKQKPISDLDKHTHKHNLFYIIFIYMQFTSYNENVAGSETPLGSWLENMDTHTRKDSAVETA